MWGTCPPLPIAYSDCRPNGGSTAYKPCLPIWLKLRSGAIPGLLLDPDYLQAKLNGFGPELLIGDFDLLSNNDGDSDETSRPWN